MHIKRLKLQRICLWSMSHSQQWLFMCYCIYNIHVSSEPSCSYILTCTVVKCVSMATFSIGHDTFCQSTSCPGDSVHLSRLFVLDWIWQSFSFVQNIFHALVGRRWKNARISHTCNTHDRTEGVKYSNIVAIALWTKQMEHLRYPVLMGSIVLYWEEFLKRVLDISGSSNVEDKTQCHGQYISNSMLVTGRLWEYAIHVVVFWISYCAWNLKALSICICGHISRFL